MTEKVGQNDPCPCGSGKKYKHCCLDRERRKRILRRVPTHSHSPNGKHFKDLGPTRRAKEFAASCDPLHGLTPDQLHRILVGPLTSPEVLSFPDPIGAEPVAPVITLFALLAEGLGEKGAKATAKGNLPRQLCRDIARTYWGDFLYEQRTMLKGIYQEADFFDLHVIRLVGQIAGLVRKYRGRFILSRDCRRRLSESGLSGIYSPLFLAYATEYNWAYPHLGDALPLIQRTCFFTLYLIARYGDKSLSNVFYEDCFLRLFPPEQHGEMRYTYHGPEQTMRSSYSWRSFREFAEPFGLVALKPYIEEGSGGRFEVRRTPLLDHAVHFHLTS